MDRPGKPGRRDGPLLGQLHQLRPTAPPSVERTSSTPATEARAGRVRRAPRRSRLARRGLLRRPGELRGCRDRDELRRRPSRPLSAPPTVTTGNLDRRHHRGAVHEFASGASGGLAPYSWTVSGGALPPGLRLAPDGTLSGTPTISGSTPSPSPSPTPTSCPATRFS